MRKSYLAFVFSLFVINASSGPVKKKSEKETKTKKENRIIFGDTTQTTKLTGIASYYADKFIGRKTATGASYTHKKLTAACNLLPLGTWIRVTNLSTMQSIIVQINDRLHRKNKRVVDLSYAGAKMLGYIKNGLAHVSLEVLSDGLATQ